MKQDIGRNSRIFNHSLVRSPQRTHSLFYRSYVVHDVVIGGCSTTINQSMDQ